MSAVRSLSALVSIGDILDNEVCMIEEPDSWDGGLEQIFGERSSSLHHGAPRVVDILEQGLHNMFTRLLHWMHKTIGQADTCICHKKDGNCCMIPLHQEH